MSFELPEGLEVPIPPWIVTALAELGVSEIPGKENEKRILEYHSFTKLRATEDEVPWCSSYACFSMERSGFAGTRSAAASSWETYGNKITYPVFGCIAVLLRGSDATKRHVGFFMGFHGKDSILLLAGNQGDKVSIEPFLKSHVVGYRLP